MARSTPPPASSNRPWERPLDPRKDLPDPTPPPGPSFHLGKPAARFVAERWRGTFEHSHEKGLVLKVKAGKRLSWAKLGKELQSYEGWSFELMVYQDEDPDVQFRIAEALEMMDGTLESQSRSIYVGRIQHELSQAFPDRAFEVSLVRESIWVRPCDERERSYRMESPKLGFWIMSVAQGKGDKTLLEGASFMDCVYELIEREREQSEEER